LEDVHAASSPFETQYHMLHCHKNEERENALDTLYLRPPNDKGTAHTAKIFLDLVSQWMTNPIDTPSTQSLRQQENEIYLRSSCMDYTTALQRAIVEQTRIGWHNATRGYTGRLWFDVIDQEQRNQLNATPHQQQGYSNQSMAKTLATLKQMTDLLWQGRNQALHHQSSNRTRQITTIRR
jgi:hypothetical protein